MAILPTYNSYFDRDFDALRARIVALIQSVFPEWTDDAVANFGNLLLESFCFVGDVTNFYVDRAAREARFAFVTQMKNMIALCKLIGYEPSAASVASGSVTLTITNAGALSGIVTHPTSDLGVVVRTNDLTAPVRGELDGPVSFNLGLGETSKTFTWRHAVTQPTFVVFATGLPDQRVFVPYGPFVDRLDGVPAEVVWTSEGTWLRVDDFLDADATDLVYRRSLDQNGFATLIFGDGQNGKIPTGNINVRARVGGGTAGNVEAGALKKLETSFTDSLGAQAYITATNAAACTGGGPMETVNAARVNAPASLRVLTRTVSREDYEINALRVTGVGRALMLTSNEDPYIDENTGNLSVLPVSGGTPSQALLDAVETMCTVTYPHTATFQLAVRPVAYQTVHVAATVYRKPNTTASAVRAAIEAALEDYFSPLLADGTPNPNVDFGFYMRDVNDDPANEIPLSTLFDIVRNAEGVRKVGAGDGDFLLNGVHSDVGVELAKFPALGTVTLIDGDTGGTL